MTDFVGPSYKLGDVQAACQRTVNMYVQRVSTPEKAQFILRAFPGFSATEFADVGDAFAPPSGLLFHLRGEGTNGSTTFTDQVLGRTWTVNYGTPTISTAQKKFNDASILSPSASSILLSSSRADFLITGDYSIEGWVYALNVAGSGSIVYLSTAFTAGTNRDIRLEIGPTGTNSGIVHTCGQSEVGANSAAGSIYNRWVHVFAGRQGNTIYAGCDGKVSSYTLPATQTPQVPTNIYVNSLASIAGTVYQYVDEVRMYVGECRYTSDYTPPVFRF